MAERVLLGMSGGVDSSTAALLLLRQGYDVTGVTLRLWSESDGQGEDETAAGIGCADDSEMTAESAKTAGCAKISGSANDRNASAQSGTRNGRVASCCSVDDVADARRVAARLGIPHYVLNFRETIRQQVVTPFLDACRSGLTPNPCILCNQRTKFETLLHRARAMGFDYVATGHYVRVATDPANGRRLLLRGLESARDQSYFLYGLSQEQLRQVLFPVGDWRKADLRTLAAQAGLCTAAKPDSQDICFVGADGLPAFLQRQGATGQIGPFVGPDGRILGQHRGIGCYTVGQRKGLGLACGERIYVTGINAADASVHLGGDADLYRPGLIAEDVRLTADSFGSGCAASFQPFAAQARIRSQGRLAAAWISPLPASGQVQVVFQEPQRAVTPGQAVVFYEGDIVLGGGRIVRAL